MKRLSLQWRITLMTALLIAGACICLNLLLYRSGASGMDNLNGYVLQYQQDGGEDLTIEIPEDQMSDFLVQFSQEVYDTKTIFGRKGWCITAVVTLFSAAIAYFISGKAQVLDFGLVGRRNGSRIAEVALLFRRLFGQDVTVISVFALDLSCAGEGKTLLRSGIGFHFRHCRK